MRNLFILLFCFCVSNAFSQSDQSFWKTTNEALIEVAPSDRDIVPDHYEAFHLDIDGLRNSLKQAPMEFSEEARNSPYLMDLPMPDGSLITFKVTKSPLMMPELAAKFSQIQTYAGYSSEEGGIKLRFTLSQLGFSGSITKLVDNETYYIDRYAKGQTEYYISYNVLDHNPNIPQEHLTCGLDDSNIPAPVLESVGTSSATSAGARGAGDIVNLRVYRIAITTTGEWAGNQGGVPNVLAKITEGVTRLNQIFEVDLALRVVMAENSDLLIFTDAATDPFPDSQNSGQMININTPTINDIIGFDNYDIGHLFDNSCNTGGLAGLGVVCGGNKGNAITCHYTNDFEYAITQITAHEIGHQFNAPHTWNRCSLTDLDNINSGTAYEPGSGNTIMSYYGVCNPTQNVEQGPHDYYHVNSLERIYNFTTDGNGASCPMTTPTDNHFPMVTLNYDNGFYIPIGTPFELNADATDEDDDMLTYSWEQYNLSALNTFLGSPEGDEPSFRSFPPADNSLRVFPRMQSLVTNQNTAGEVLPSYSRNFTFRCSVRDNNPIIGAATWAEMSFEATETAGPFAITYPSSTTTWTVGEDQEITWNVANTDGSLVNCQKVNILLSTDGGYNYPITLAANVTNDGSHVILVPQEISSTARIRVEAANNIFFDISNNNFNIIEATEASFNFTVSPDAIQVCLPENPVIEIPMMSILGYDDPVDFTVNGLPTGAVANFSNNPATPTEGTSLTIDMTNADQSSTSFEITVDGMAVGIDTHSRVVALDVISNDFSTLALAEPAYGELGVGEVPTFDWATTSNAITYEFQLATSPSFEPSTIIDNQTGLVAPPFTTEELLPKSTPYYWRVRPVNVCGPGPYTTVFAFHTEVLSCNSFQSVNVPVPISAQGTPTIESIIQVNQGGIISDLNVTKIQGSHNLIRDIAVRLVSPDNTSATLFSGICQGSNSAPFHIGIDDDAPIPIFCPPNTGASVRPQSADALAVFNGQESQGTWTLEVEVIDSDGSGGGLDNWHLEICTNTSAAAPFLVNNETLLVPPGEFNYVFTDQLLSEDSDNTPNELIYTLIEKPEQGDLIFNGSVVEVGGTFRQISIDAGNVTYQHTPNAALTDQFVFTVSDGSGGWIPPTVFTVQMDANAMVGTNDLSNTNELMVFPNPTKDLLNVKLATPVNAAVDVRIYNLQGKLIAAQSSKTGMDLIQFDTEALSAGLYFVELTLGNESLVEKVAVYK